MSAFESRCTRSLSLVRHLRRRLLAAQQGAGFSLDQIDDRLEEIELILADAEPIISERLAAEICGEAR